MKKGRVVFWIVIAATAIGVLYASESTRTREGRDRLDFSYDSSWSGRPLTSPESTAVSTAICSIRTAPPDSFRYTDAQGSTRTVSCSTLAGLLQDQLNKGTMQAETLNNADGGELNDEININDDILRHAIDSSDTRYLEELLVHEGTHKNQSNSLSEEETEIPAYAAELAYKDSIGLDSSDAEYRFVRDKLAQYRRVYAYNELKRQLEAHWITRWIVRYLPKDPPENWQLAAFQLGDSEENLYDLGAQEVTDMLSWEGYFADGASLILLLGPNRDMGGTQLSAFRFNAGFIHEPAPFWTMLFPPGFYSMAYHNSSQSFFLVDTLTRTIWHAPDMNGDKLPDGPLDPWANRESFPMLEGMLSVIPTTHPVFGSGIIVNYSDAHYSRWVRPYTELPFLQDMDGMVGADMVHLCMKYEFVNIQPRIEDPLPWAGDMFCTVFGTWQHPIEVWRTDPTGEIMLQFLGVTFLEDDIFAECPLIEPLLAGGHILAFDPVSGKRLRLPYEVKDPTPQEMTIIYDPVDEVLIMDWSDVEGAGGYLIEVSEDGSVWEDMGILVDESEYVVSLVHVDEVIFRVRAIR